MGDEEKGQQEPEAEPSSPEVLTASPPSELPAATTIDKGSPQTGDFESSSASHRRNGSLRSLVLEDAPQSTLRLLCPLGVVGGIIGKRGDNVRRICQETRAEVAVEDQVPLCEERVVVVQGERVDDEASTSTADGLCAVFDTLCTLSDRSAGLGGAAAEGRDPAEERHREARLLVDSSQIGFLVGKGGVHIKDTMQKSGAQIRILPKTDLPPCACVGDEVVRVQGSTHSVRQALQLLGQQLKQYPPRPRQRYGGGYAGPGGGMGLGPGGGHMLLAHAAHPDLSVMQQGFYQAGMGPQMYSGTMVETTFWLLAPLGRTGNIIGRGGEQVRRIRGETGARIKVLDPVGVSEERLVLVTSTEDAASPYCAAQDALIRCVISLTAGDTPGALHRVRLLTPQASVGVVLGRKGATVSQLRQETGAAIKVLPVEPAMVAAGPGSEGDAPPEVDEVVQVEGAMQQCIAALRGVATLLRGWHVRRVLMQQQAAGGGGGGMGQPLPASQHLAPPPPQQQHMPTPVPLHMGPHQTSPGMAGAPGGMQMSPQNAPYMLVNGGGYVPAGPRMQISYTLDNLQVGAVVGKGGDHINQIRQMTGARIVLQGGGELAEERTLEVSGAPDQCQAVHNMLNGYLAMARCEPAFPLSTGGM